VRGAQDSSSFILLHEHSQVFQIIYTYCPGNVCPGIMLSGKHLSGKVIVRETSVTHLTGPRLGFELWTCGTLRASRSTARGAQLI